MLRKIFNLIPENVREKIKLSYYNCKHPDFIFSFKDRIYKTESITGWSVFTRSPLYFTVRDIQRYEKYYSVVPGDIVMDAGANVGVFTLIYSKKIKETGTVYAFEPDKKNINKLKENLAINNNNANIALHDKGLWDKEEEIAFFEAGTVGSSVFPNSETAVKKRIRVTTIDDFVRSQKLQRLDFVKMDIEGAEIQALIGAKMTIEKMRPNFAIASYHFVDGVQTYKKIEKIFQDFNYPHYTHFFSDGEVMTYAGPHLERPHLIIK